MLIIRSVTIYEATRKKNSLESWKPNTIRDTLIIQETEHVLPDIIRVKLYRLDRHVPQNRRNMKNFDDFFNFQILNNKNSRLKDY